MVECEPHPIVSRDREPPTVSQVIPGLRAVVVACFLTSSLRLLGDADVYLHLATARWIHVHGAVPSTDPFSFTAHGQEWVAHEWLAAILTARVFEWGGEWALVIGTILVGLVLMIVTDRILALSVGEGTLSRAAGLGITALLTINVMQPRPHLATLLGLVATRFALLSLSVRSDARPLVAVLPGYALWGNMHAGFALVGLPWMMAIVDPFRTGLTSLRSWLILASGAAAGIGLLCINPDGWHHLAYPFRYVGGAAFKLHIQEWTPLDPTRDMTLIVGIGLVLLCAMLPRPRARPGVWISLPLALIFACQANRNVFLVGLFGAELVAGAVSRAVRTRERLGRLEALDRRHGFVIPLLLLISGTAFVTRHQDFRSETTRSLVRCVEQAGSKLDGARVFNHYSLAGVILFHAPRVSVFIDSRVDLYEKAGILDDYLEIHGLDPGWDVLLDAWKVDAIIYPTTHPLIHALTQRGWIVLSQDHSTSILARPAPVSLSPSVAIQDQLPGS